MDKKGKIIEDKIKCLGKEEKDNIIKMVSDIGTYISSYLEIRDHISNKYFNDSIPRSKIMEILKMITKIETAINKLHITIGERIIIYNRLSAPLIKNEFKDRIDLIKTIDDLNSLSKNLHPFLNSEKIDKVIKIIEEELKDKNREEKLLIYTLIELFYIENFLKFLAEKKNKRDELKKLKDLQNIYA